jgi:hypothetical protein
MEALPPKISRFHRESHLKGLRRDFTDVLAAAHPVEVTLHLV